MMRIPEKVKKVFAASAIALALMAPGRDVTITPQNLQRTAFERLVVEQNQNRYWDGFVCLPTGIGLFGAGSVPASIIASIQTFAITIATSASTGTASLTAITVANAMIVYGGGTTSDTAAAGAAPDADIAYATITSSTQVTATRNTASGSVTATIKGTVVEFTSAAIQSIQAGTITLTAATSNTATITGVTLSNAFVAFSGLTGTFSGSSYQSEWTRLNFTNTTTITATRSGSASNITISYFAVEFKASILNSSTQEATITLTAASSNTGTITSITTSQACLIYAGRSGTMTSNDQQLIPYIQLTNATTITVTRQGSTNNVTIVVTVLEFKSSQINSLQRNTGTIGNGATTGDITITAVTVAKCFASYLGHTAGASLTANHTGMIDVILNSTTVIRGERNTSSTVVITFSAEGVEFK